MSETETHMGSLRKVDLEGKTIEEFCQNFYKVGNISSFEPDYSSWTDRILDENMNEFFLVKNGNGDKELWEMIESRELHEDVNEFKKDLNNNISFVVQFYNGGTCLSEVIEEGIESINNG